MQKIIYKNPKGAIVEIGNNAPFILEKFDDEPALDHLTTKAPSQDGKTLLGTTIEESSIKIDGAIITKDRADMYNKKKLLNSTFNPKLGEGELIYINESGERKIKAIIEDFPSFKQRYASNLLFTIEFVAYSSFWEDAYKTIVNLAYIMGGLSFPLKLPSKFSNRAYKRTITNIGDVAAPVEIIYQGYAKNPTITNVTTGEYITIEKELQKDEKLIVNTEVGKKKVEIEDKNGIRTNAFNLIKDLDSTFWQLQQGENVIAYSSDTENTEAIVTIKFTNRYVGC